MEVEMTIEIKELIIKTVVTEGQSDNLSGSMADEVADRIRSDFLADCRAIVKDVLEELEGR